MSIPLKVSKMYDYKHIHATRLLFTCVNGKLNMFHKFRYWNNARRSVPLKTQGKCRYNQYIYALHA